MDEEKVLSVRRPTFGIHNTLGARLKKVRQIRKITQQKLADLIGIKQQAIQRIEAGKVRGSTYIVPIAMALQVSPIWLASGKESEPILLESIKGSKLTQSIFPSLPLFTWEEIVRDPKITLTEENESLRPQVPAFLRVSGKAFALQIDQKTALTLPTATDTLQQQTIIFIDPLRDLRHQDFVLAKDTVLMLRQYLREDRKQKPQLAANGSHPATVLNKRKQKILGVVVGQYCPLI